MAEKVTNEMLAGEIRSLADQQMRFHVENREDHQRIFTDQNKQGQRITVCETEIGHLKPKVEKACNGVKATREGQAGIRGQWKTLAWIIGVVVALGLGVLARQLFGG